MTQTKPLDNLKRKAKLLILKYFSSKRISFMSKTNKTKAKYNRYKR